MLNYIGSKKTLLPFLDAHIKPVCVNDTVFADLFAGTGVVARHFKGACKHVITNDAEYYSFVVNYAMLRCDYSDKLCECIERLNAIAGVDGLMARHFSIERQFFTESNARKMDAIRQQIQAWKDVEYIDLPEYYFLIACLLCAADKVANTASVYGSYLKQFKASAMKDLVVLPIHQDASVTTADHNVYQGDALSLILDTGFACDVAYIDPPYNHRQYAANYSPLNYLALYDDLVQIKGKGGLINNYFKSPFCQKANAADSFESLIKNTKAKHIFVSYNNEGLLSHDDMIGIFQKFGRVTLHTREYKKFLSQRKACGAKIVTEYLFHIDRSDSHAATPCC